MQNLLILGEGETLSEAVRIAEQASDSFHVVALELQSADRYNFALPDLAQYGPDEWQAFVALDHRGLNMSRVQVVAQLKAVGYRLARLVSKNAVVGKDVTLGENAFVGEQAIIGENCRLGLNVIVRSRAIIGANCIIGSSNYIDIGAVLESDVKTGDFVTVGAGSVLAAGTNVGKQSELRQRTSYSGIIAPRTFYIPIFPRPVRIISPL